MSNYRFASWPAYNGKKVLLDGEPGQVVYAFNNTTPLRLKVYTVNYVTNASGAIAVPLPAGYFTTVHGVQVTVLRDSTNATEATFAQVRSWTPTVVNIQCFEGKTSGVLIGGVIDGLETTTTSVTCLVYAYGVGA